MFMIRNVELLTVFGILTSQYGTNIRIFPNNAMLQFCMYNNLSLDS
jgi:hypothetical protein